MLPTWPCSHSEQILVYLQTLYLQLGGSFWETIIISSLAKFGQNDKQMKVSPPMSAAVCSTALMIHNRNINKAQNLGL